MDAMGTEKSHSQSSIRYLSAWYGCTKIDGWHRAKKTAMGKSPGENRRFDRSAIMTRLWAQAALYFREADRNHNGVLSHTEIELGCGSI